MASIGVDDALAGILAGDRVRLARAITLLESRRPDHRDAAQALLVQALPHAGTATRIGITGVPGVGKSTFIDAFGSRLTGRGHKVAVLALDPSSGRTGGSILGDKTRMARLAVDPHAFIRPSPAAGALGGVGRVTRETLLLCEAAGHDVVLVETVGVGQSETVVAEMVDLFMVLALPGAGDSLQGIKKGLVELADLVVINKADGANLLAAQQAARHYAEALSIIEPVSPQWRPRVVTVSALTGDGLDALWELIGEHRRAMGESGALADRRRAQMVGWFRSLLRDELLRRFLDDPALVRRCRDLEAEVSAQRVTPPQAVAALLRDAGTA